MNPTEKKCSHCKEIKSVSLFSKNSGNKDLLQNSCKKCVNEQGRISYRRRLARLAYHKNKVEKILDKHIAVPVEGRLSKRITTLEARISRLEKLI
jgi:hypothetical protein